MLWDIILLFLGAILGTLFSFAPKLYKDFMAWTYRRQALARKSLLGDIQKIYKWLYEYYDDIDQMNHFHNCKIGELEIKIPFFTKREWQDFLLMPYDKDMILAYAQTAPQEFQVNKSLLEKRKKLGQTLFNNPILYIDRIEQKDEHVLLHVKTCDFYQLASSLVELEEETFKPIKKNKTKHLFVRDKFVSSLPQIEKMAPRPYGVGCAVVLALKTKESYDILIHTRSHATFTFGGAKAVTPNFALAPIVGNEKNLNSSKNTPTSNRGYKIRSVLYYNFIKEYLEELYNYEELINLMGSRKSNPFWFYDLPEAKELIKLIEQDKFRLEFLGFGFDVLNGNGVVAVLGKVDDIVFANKLRKTLELNWEISNQGKGIDVEFLDIRSEILEQWLREQKYHTGAAFAISRALERLIGND